MSFYDWLEVYGSLDLLYHADHGVLEVVRASDPSETPSVVQIGLFDFPVGLDLPDRGRGEAPEEEAG